MSVFSDFLAQIADYANRQDWSTNLLTGFVRMAEEKFNQELRVAGMIETVTINVKGRSAPAPSDWLAYDLVLAQSTLTPSGFIPIRYKSRDEFFNLTDAQAVNYYTIEGETIYFGGTPDLVNGINYELSYYGQVPVFSDTLASWVYTQYPSLYLYAALMHSDLYAVGEEAKAANLKQLVEDKIDKLNKAHLASKASGSRITRSRVRSFG